MKKKLLVLALVLGVIMGVSGCGTPSGEGLSPEKVGKIPVVKCSKLDLKDITDEEGFIITDLEYDEDVGKIVRTPATGDIAIIPTKDGEYYPIYDLGKLDGVEEFHITANVRRVDLGYLFYSGVKKVIFDEVVEEDGKLIKRNFSNLEASILPWLDSDMYTDKAKEEGYDMSYKYSFPEEIVFPECSLAYMGGMMDAKGLKRIVLPEGLVIDEDEEKNEFMFAGYPKEVEICVKKGGKVDKFIQELKEKSTDEENYFPCKVVYK